MEASGLDQPNNNDGCNPMVRMIPATTLKGNGVLSAQTNRFLDEL